MASYVTAGTLGKAESFFTHTLPCSQHAPLAPRAAERTLSLPLRLYVRPIPIFFLISCMLISESHSGN